MNTFRYQPSLALVLLTACGGGPKLEGRVVDTWNKPVEGATVQVEGQVEQVQTDANGNFSFDAPKGDVKVQAGKDGYIRHAVAVAVPAEGDLPTAEISIFPEPDQPGFYVVGGQEYVHLEAHAIDTVGTDLQAQTGLKDIGSATVGGPAKIRVVFSSTLRTSELAQLDLQLHSLEFVDSAKVPGVLGEEEVKINRWVPVESSAYDLKGLPSEDDYLITTRTELQRGVYAFHTGGALTSKDLDALASIPEEMRVAYTFEVK